MLFKISLRNIRRSMRDYAIYFFTLIIGVSIFYVFNAISGQAAMLRINDDTRNIVELLRSVLNSVSVFVAVILGLLIVYASRFLMKRRNREFALYLLLGMEKGKISTILVLETVAVGLFSLGVGLVIGIGLSQFMSALVANLFEADMTAYRFTVSAEAIAKTILYFAVMYLVVMVLNSAAIAKLKLIDLMQSGRKAEQIRIKNPILSGIVFLAGAALLGYAYYKVAYDTASIHEAREILLYIAMGAVGTFFLFWSVAGMFLHIFRGMKSVYFRGLNSFTFRQLSSKIGTMVFSMTVVCLMLFVTICSLSGAFTIRNTLNANLNELCPADYEINFSLHASTDDEHASVDDGHAGTNEEYVYCDITDIYTRCGSDITAEFKEYVHFHTYMDKNFTFGAMISEAQMEELRSWYSFLDYDNPFELVKLSDYNHLMALYGRDPLSMSDEEFILLCNFRSTANIYNEVLSAERPMTILGHTLRAKSDQCQDGFISLSAQQLNTGILVIPDRIAPEDGAWLDYFIGNYNADTREEKQAAEEQAKQKCLAVRDRWIGMQQGGHVGYRIGINTRIDIAQGAIGIGAIATFLGLYIGLVFLIACGAILALKELSESADSARQYEMLRKIGAEESDISKSLFRQTGIFFLLPMILAIIHSVFGMKFAAVFLELFGTERGMASIIATSVIILLIYGGYFLITYFCSKGIVRSQTE